VRFQPGLAELEGRLFFGGLSVGVESQGHFVIEDGVRLIYVVDRLSVEKSEVPAFIVNMFEEGIGIGIDLSALPFGYSLRAFIYTKAQSACSAAPRREAVYREPQGTVDHRMADCAGSARIIVICVDSLAEKPC